jgi:NAD(P)H dehydrogenase (quinone)
MTVKLAIIYYSSTGANHQLARLAEEAAREAGAEVRVAKVRELAPESAIASNPAWKRHYDATKDVPEASPDDVDWADALLFSTPTRFGNVASQMKQFLDTMGGLWAQGKMVNKPVTAMSSAQNDHGGQEATILSLYTTMYHWGAIVVAPGYTSPVLFEAGGNPYGTSATVDAEGNIGNAEKIREAVRHQTKRLLEVAGMLKKGAKA